MLALTLYSSTKQKPLGRRRRRIPVRNNNPENWKKRASSRDNIWIAPEPFSSSLGNRSKGDGRFFFSFKKQEDLDKEKTPAYTHTQLQRWKKEFFCFSRDEQRRRRRPHFGFPRPVFPPSGPSFPSQRNSTPMENHEERHADERREILLLLLLGSFSLCVYFFAPHFSIIFHELTRAHSQV